MLLLPTAGPGAEAQASPLPQRQRCLQLQFLCTQAGVSAQGHVTQPHGRSVADSDAPSGPCTVGSLPKTIRQGFPSRPARAVEGLLAHFMFPSTGFLVGYATPFPRNPEGECSKEPWNPPVPGCYLSTCSAGFGRGCPSCPTHQTGLRSSHRALLHGRGTCASSRPLVILYFI